MGCSVHITCVVYGWAVLYTLRVWCITCIALGLHVLQSCERREKGR